MFLKKPIGLRAVKIKKERKDYEKKDFSTHRNQMGISNQYKGNQRVGNELFQQLKTCVLLEAGVE